MGIESIDAEFLRSIFLVETPGLVAIRSVFRSAGAISPDRRPGATGRRYMLRNSIRWNDMPGCGPSLTTC